MPIYVGRTSGPVAPSGFKSVYVGSTKVYEKSAPVLPNYLWLQNVSGSDAEFKCPLLQSGSTTVTEWKTIEVSKNRTTWTSTLTGLTVHPGEKLYVRSTSSDAMAKSGGAHHELYLTKAYNVGGVLNSLINDVSLTATSLPAYAFYKLFPPEVQSTFLPKGPLMDASELILSNYTSSNCYGYLFAESHIITPPALPATSLNTSCYSYMFNNCSSLTRVPKLPALSLFRTALGSNSNAKAYYNMFDGCSSLKVYASPTADVNIPWYIPSSDLPFNNEGKNYLQTDMFKGVITDSVPATFPGADNTMYIYYVENIPV